MANTANGGPNADNMKVSLSTLLYEAEDLTLSNYTIQSSEYASNDQYVETTGAGTATVDFSGPAAVAGQYYINTYYFDTTDGQSDYTLSINDTAVDTWIADKNLGSSSIGESTYVCHQTLVTLATDDVIEVQGIADGTENATLDVLGLAPVVRENYEAESSTLSGYTVQDGISGSSAQYVQTTGSGSITTAFMSYPGAYDLEIYYFDENDGASSYTLQVDGATVDTWLAESDFNGVRIYSLNRFNCTVFLVSRRGCLFCSFVQGENHILRGQFTIVSMELNSFAKFKGPHKLVVGNLPALCKVCLNCFKRILKYFWMRFLKFCLL